MTVSASFLARWIDRLAGLLREEATGAAVVLVGFVLFTLLEVLFPAERGQSWSGRLRNLCYMALYEALGLSVLAGVYAAAFPPSMPERATSGLPVAWLVPAHLLAVDFLYYWYHRAQHRFAFLWAIHELHHADAELNVTTSYRTHWLEAPVQALVVGAPVVLLFGRQGVTFTLVTLVATRFFFLFSHCNLRLPLGRLSAVLCGPQWHRIHHSRLAPHHDRNFAQIFPVFDRLFGTYYEPGRDEYPPTGTEHLASEAPVWRAELRPFLLWAAALSRRLPPS